MKRKNLLVLALCVLFALTSFLIDKKSEPIALIVAVGDYPEASQWSKLGSVNDSEIITETLKKQGFRRRKITTLHDDQATRAGILQAIQKDLIDKAKQGASVIFHFSGHGQQIWDDNGDEIDGYDEAIVPYDSPSKHFKKGAYEGEKLIRDDELGKLFLELRRKLGREGHLLVLIDACHSGTSTRGFSRSRGTDVIMADPTYIAKHAHLGNDDNSLNETPSDDEHNLAPMVAIFGSSAHEQSEEFTPNDGNGKTYGALSYAFCKAFSRIDQTTSYRGLYDQIRLQVSAHSANQTPQAEGDLDQTVLGGHVTGLWQYFTISDWTDQHTVKLRHGTLDGLYTGTKVAFYPSDRTPSDQPLAAGTVQDANLLECRISLNQPLSEEMASKSWIFITEQNYGDLYVKVKVNIPDGDFKTNLLGKINNVSAIKMVDNQADVLVEYENGQVVLSSAIGFELLSKKLHGKDYKIVATKMIRGMVGHAQAQFLRSLEMKDNKSLNAEFEFNPKMAMDERGNASIKVKEKCWFTVKNTGARGFYFILIDIQPDNQLNVIIPYAGGKKAAADYFLPKGETFTYEDSPLVAGCPCGTEVFKLIATTEALDLKNLISSRGDKLRGKDDLHPLEQLLRESFFDQEEFRGDDGKTSSMSGMEAFVTSVVFEIKK